MDSCISYGLRLDARIDRRLREAVRQFDAVGAISEDVFRQYLSLGLEAESIRTIPNGTVTGRFGSAPEDLWCAKNRLNIQDRRPIVLTVGRNHPKKGFVAIPDVARHLNKQGLEFYWLLVGRGMTDLLKGIAPGDPLRETLIPIEELPPAACAKGTLGPSEELLSYYAMSDVFAFPSNMEGLPLVGVEALAAGLPIVATSAPGCVDLVSDNVNGLLSAPGDHSAMARNIESLLRDPVRRDRLARNSQELAPAYDWDRVADQYIELYRDICSQGL
jgi:glycosyltransferase involved in cell wall biosynthesis